MIVEHDPCRPGKCSNPLKKAVQNKVVRHAILKDDEAYKGLYNQLQSIMTRTWDVQARDAVAASLERLSDLGPGKFTQADAVHILSVLEQQAGSTAMLAAMRRPVLNISDALFRVGVKEVSKSAGVDIAFDPTDFDALDIVKDSNLFWIENHWNGFTRGLFNDALTDYFTEGMSREQLARRFAEDFAPLSKKGQVYWELMADHTATKTREMGRVTGYDRAGISAVQVRANLDHKTTPVCREMHGRVITTNSMVKQRGDYLAAISKRDHGRAKAAWTMHSSPDAVAGKRTSKLPVGTAMPPYHFRCRTITVMYIIDDETEVGSWTRKAYDREQLSRQELAAVVERAKSAKWGRHKIGSRYTNDYHRLKHGGSVGAAGLGAYNEKAVNVVRRGSRDIYISVNNGHLYGWFVEPPKKAGRKRSSLVTIVDLTDNEIKTFHARGKLPSRRDEVPPIKQKKGRGITKWF